MLKKRKFIFTTLWQKKVLILLGLLIFAGLNGCTTRAPYNYYDSQSLTEENTPQGQLVAKTALSQIGKPYRFGGLTPKTGFDCSGLIYWSYKQHGLELPRIAKEQMRSGHKVTNGKLRPGDIVGFQLSRNRYHTGIYIGKGQFVHSPSKGKKVQVEELRTPYWKKKFVSVNRVL